MRMGNAWKFLIPLSFFTGTVYAQQPSTVQLPTFSSTSAGSTLWVPDRGSALLGGIGSASTGRGSFGVPLAPIRPLRNSAITGGYGASSMRVNVTIHDFEAMDKYLLGQTVDRQSGDLSLPPTYSESNHPIDPRVSSAWQGAKPASDQTLLSPEGEQARHVVQQASRASEAQALLQRGQQAQTEGKLSVARIYYQMAARRATGELRKQIDSRLQSIDRSAAHSTAGNNRP